MEKYGNLPGIDTESQDIFETSDIESEAELENEPESTEVEALVADPHTIRSRYANDVIDGTASVDFSGSITNPVLGATGYSVRRVDETREQKLARIARELDELMAENASQDTKKLPEDAHNTPPKAPHTASSSQAPIDPSKLIELLHQAEAGPSASNPYQTQLTAVMQRVSARINEKAPSAESKLPQSPSETLELESRLAALEALIGDVGTSSIQNLLSDLSRKIKIIHNPEYPIDRVKQEVKNLAEETEKLRSQRKLLEVSGPVDLKTESTEAKIDELYRQLPELQHGSRAVPLIIRRLKSLHGVHADIGHSIDVVGTLDTTLSEMNSEMQEWDESINALNTNLDSYNKNFEENRSVIVARIDELGQRIARME